MNIFFGFEVDENISEDDKWNIIFVKRSNLLSRCDWTQLPDSGLSFLKRLEWQTYRDALRSIQDDFPKNRQGITNTLTSLKGKSIKSMTANEKEKLLIVVCDYLGISEQGTVL